MIRLAIRNSNVNKNFWRRLLIYFRLRIKYRTLTVSSYVLLVLLWEEPADPVVRVAEAGFGNEHSFMLGCLQCDATSVYLYGRELVVDVIKYFYSIAEFRQ